MAGSGVTLYANNAAGNKAIVGTIDWRENIYMPSQINDNCAQIMADIRAMMNNVANGWVEFGDGDGVYTATYVAANQFMFAGIDVTLYYRPGMRVYVVMATSGGRSGTITASAFSANTIVTVAWDAGGLVNEPIVTVLLGVGSGDAANPAAAISKSYRNVLGRNGGLQVWQRGAGGSALFNPAPVTGLYTADGWALSTQANETMWVAQTAGVPVAGLPTSRYAAFLQRAAGQTGTGGIVFEYPLDSDELWPLRGNIVTLSFSSFYGADFSPASRAVTAVLACGTGAPAKIIGGYTGVSYPINSGVFLTSLGTRQSVTSSVVVPATTTQASVHFIWTPVGTAGAQDAWVVGDVQLEIGVATPFERRPFEQELAACQRHYWKSFDYAVAPATGAGADVESAIAFSQVVGASGTQGAIQQRFPVIMRVPPTVTLFNPAAANAQIRNLAISADWSGTGAIASTKALRIYGAAPAASGVGQHSAVHAAADAGI